MTPSAGALSPFGWVGIAGLLVVGLALAGIIVGLRRSSASRRRRGRSTGAPDASPAAQGVLVGADPAAPHGTA